MFALKNVLFEKTFNNFFFILFCLYLVADQLNGLKVRPPSNVGAGKDKKTNSVDPSEDGEENSSVVDEDDESAMIIELLSSVSSPQVMELLPRSALLSWPALSESEKNSDLDIAESELGYEVLLADIAKGGKYRSIYNGCSLSCRQVFCSVASSLLRKNCRLVLGIQYRLNSICYSNN